jgi:hypothetical protein
MTISFSREGKPALRILKAPPVDWINEAALRAVIEARIGADVAEVDFMALDRLAGGLWGGGTIILSEREPPRGREYRSCIDPNTGRPN